MSASSPPSREPFSASAEDVQPRDASVGRSLHAELPDQVHLEAAIVLSVVGEGMPLIYNGQEAGHDKRLQFFERDPIVWREHPLGELYR